MQTKVSGKPGMRVRGRLTVGCLRPTPQGRGESTAAFLQESRQWGRPERSGFMQNNDYFDPVYWYRPVTHEKMKVISRYKTKVGLPFLIFLLSYMVLFSLLERMPRLHYTIIHMAIDDRIPFLEGFVIPYFSWFAYITFYTVYLFLNDEAAYHRIAAFLAIGMGGFLVVSLLFPNILMIRPQVMPRHNIFTEICQLLYAMDTPTNVTPSIHVFNSIGIMIAVWDTDCPMFRSKKRKLLMDLWGLTIILSTMFIKQHSVSDVIVGTGCALAVYIVVYRLGFVFRTVEGDRRNYRQTLIEVGGRVDAA